MSRFSRYIQQRIVIAAALGVMLVAWGVGHLVDPVTTASVVAFVSGNLSDGSALPFVALMGATAAPFPIQPDLTAIAVMYRNKDMIADQVMPRVPVGKQDFKYLKHALADGFTIPDTKVGRTSPPTRVEFTATETSASCLDYGLDDSVPQADIENAPPNYDPLGKATEFVTNLIELDREKRVATLAFDTNQYGSSNKSTLSGTSQWSDYTNANPVDAILAALDVMVMRANIMVIGQAVWTKLRQHPKVLASLYGSASTRGVALRQDLADVLELQQLLVGQSWVNSAKKGQTATLGRVWGKHCALIYRDSLATAERGTSWGFTAQFGSRIAGSFEDKDAGMRGGTRVRAGESVKEVVSANDLGYLFINAVA